MTTQIQESPVLEDLSLIAIEAAEELERYKRGYDTDFTYLNLLSTLLQSSFNQKVDNSGATTYRLDHASVLSSTFYSINRPKKTLAEIASGVNRIVKILVPGQGTKDTNLDELISFCVALSDSAAIYNEELNELRKH